MRTVPDRLHAGKTSFGTSAVFLTAISTILGAIMFLRFGYAVGSVGFLGVLLIITIGHMVTIPTAMALAEIATNQKVEGGGEYYIVSRSFGLTIGSAIGIALYFSQAISVAFYIIAFAEAFAPVFAYVRETWNVDIQDPRWVSLPALLGLGLLLLTKGAVLGMRALYAVVATLLLSLALFFMGRTDHSGTATYQTLIDTVSDPDPMFVVFAICFPAFTGMTAGVGLSGDLRDPKRAIPIGTLAATLTGMVIYVLIAYKLAVSMPPETLVGDQLVMSRIALWGPIIPIGLACATLSSSIGSFLVAPRTLQAIASDAVLPWVRTSRWLARGKGAANEPYNASLVTAAIALVFVLLGDVNFVAKIISMFFMVTYGAICTISFLEHFAADPSYRPTFRSRWYVSLFGAALCMWLMFKMSALYALLSMATMVLLYLSISRVNKDKNGLSHIAQGAIFQISRQLQVFLQKRKQEGTSWRPSVVCISQASFKRLAAFELLRWISHRYGFGTYIHLIEGYLSKSMQEEATATLERLVDLADVSRSNVYVDTVVSPAYTGAISQVIQLPGVSGKENNMILFEFAKGEQEELGDIVDNFQLVTSMGFDVAILASGDRGFGYCRQIHVWLTPGDYANANLMILLSYILLGHPDWKGGIIKIFALFPEAERQREEHALQWLIQTGRLPIASKNVEVLPYTGEKRRHDVINERSRDADLVVVGFRGEALRHQKSELFAGYDGVGNVLFLNTRKGIALERDLEEALSETASTPPEAEADAAAAAASRSPARASEAGDITPAAASKVEDDPKLRASEPEDVEKQGR